jgi:hypothetical protein
MLVVATFRGCPIKPIFVAAPPIGGAFVGIYLIGNQTIAPLKRCGYLWEPEKPALSDSLFRSPLMAA